MFTMGKCVFIRLYQNKCRKTDLIICCQPVVYGLAPVVYLLINSTTVDLLVVDLFLRISAETTSVLCDSLASPPHVPAD